MTVITKLQACICLCCAVLEATLKHLNEELLSMGAFGLPYRTNPQRYSRRGSRAGVSGSRLTAPKNASIHKSSTAPLFFTRNPLLRSCCTSMGATVSLPRHTCGHRFHADLVGGKCLSTSEASLDRAPSLLQTCSRPNGDAAASKDNNVAPQELPTPS